MQLFGWAWRWLAFSVLACSATAQTSMVVVPEELSFAVPGRTSGPARASLTVFTTPPGTRLIAGVRYLGLTGGWLSLSPDTTTSDIRTPATLDVTANASGLEPGTYTAQITLLAGNLGRAINVTLAIGNSASGSSLLVSPTTMTFTAQMGTAGPITQGLTVTSPTDATSPVIFRVSTSITLNPPVGTSAWLAVPPIPFRTPATVPVEAYPTLVPAGVYSGTITVTPESGGLPTVVPVTMVSLGNTGTPAETLRLSQTAINVAHPRSDTGSTHPPVQTVVVSSSTGNYRQYTATTKQSWIRLATNTNPGPSSVIGDIFTPFTVDIEPKGHTDNTVKGTIEITSPGVPTTTLDVNLTLTDAPALNAQPSSVVFDEAGFVMDATVNVTTASGAATVITGVDGPQWLTISPSAGPVGVGGLNLTFHADGTTVPPGVQNSSVLVKAQNGATLSIPVRLLDSSQPADVPIVWLPEALNLIGTVGGANPSQSVALRVDAGAAQDFTVGAVSTGGWLRVLPFTGRTPATLTATANLAAVPGPGTYSGSLLVTSLSSRQQFTIPVNLSVGDQILSADPATLTFAQSEKGAAFEKQTVEIKASVPTSFRVSAAPAWVRFSSMNGTTPGSLMVWPELSALPPGSAYSGVIRITGPQNQVEIPISASLAQPPQPTITPSSVTMSWVIGSPAPTQALSVQTSEPGQFTASAITGTGVQWLLLSPVSGATPGTINVTIDPDRIVTGENSGTITINITAGGATFVRTVPVKVTASPPDNTIHSILNSATLLPTAAAPGLIVSITGTGLGPVAGVAGRPTAAGAWDTQLAGIRVTFDGTPAPLLFVREDQINAVAPYAISGRVATKVRVEKGQSWSLPLDVRVVETAPGIFTAGGAGRGQAAATNADLSTNSPVTPAPRGSIITIFATGEGQTNPGGQDGRIITTDLRQPVLPVTAKVAGRPAEVLYAGSAPLQVSGMMQVNLRIPEDTPSGVVPIEIAVGGVASQSGVTIVIQ